MPRKIKHLSNDEIDKLDIHELKNRYNSARECVRCLLKNGYKDNDEDIIKKKESIKYMKLLIDKNNHLPQESIVDSCLVASDKPDITLINQKYDEIINGKKFWKRLLRNSYMK